jgi:predicted nucleotidyltransferase
MKTSLDHLPEDKRAQITAVAALLTASAPVGKLILFGSYARGDWVEDLETHYISDYDFLIIVATRAEADDKALWDRLYQQARALTGRIPVTLLVHDIKHVNAEIRVGQYFFGDIVNEGVLLHDAGRFTLARPKALNAEERLKLAEQYFGYWFQSASEFWRGAGDYAARGLGTRRPSGTSTPRCSCSPATNRRRITSRSSRRRQRRFTPRSRARCRGICRTTSICSIC